MVKRMELIEKYWIVRYMQDNDWGLPAYEETSYCYSEEELQECLNGLDFYTRDVTVEEIKEYEFEK